ncbi:8116_t:CDS:2, partial [Racocetra persica]
WARSFTPFQFNVSVQSIQSVESFNGIIKKALNSANTLCDIEKIINKKNEDESQYFLYSIEASELETINDYFIEDVLDEPQTTLQSLLSNMEAKNIIELGEFVYKDSIYTKLDFNIKNSPVFTALESPFNCSFQVIFNFQSVQNFNKSDCNKVDHKCISQRNRYEIAFSTAKTAINIVLETNKDAELIQLLKDFIVMNQKKHKGDMDESKENVITENYNSKEDQDTEEIILLQEHLIDQITSSNIIKLRGASHKRRLKAVTELSKGKAFNKVMNIVQEADHSETSSRQQRRCLLYKNPDIIKRNVYLLM